LGLTGILSVDSVGYHLPLAGGRLVHRLHPLTDIVGTVMSMDLSLR